MRPEALLSLIWFPDPPPSLSWLTITIVLWEAVVDPKTQTIKATAYEWAGPKGGNEWVAGLGSECQAILADWIVGGWNGTAFEQPHHDRKSFHALTVL